VDLRSITRKLGILGALVHRDFRLYWFGHVAAVSGQQMFQVVQAWLVYDLTGSAVQLGLAGLARAVPATILGLVGGVVADKVDQRRLLMATTGCSGIVFAVLATLAITEMVQVWHVFVTIFLVGGLQALEQPSRQAIFPNLIDRRDMMKAVGMNSTVHPGTRIFAPVLAGILIDLAGVPRQGAGIAIYVVATGYITFTYLMFRVHLPKVTRAKGGNGIQDLLDGIRYIQGRHVFRFLIGMSFVNAFFGGAHNIILPLFAERLLGESSGSALGLFFSAAGLGGLTGAILGGSLSSPARRGVFIATGGMGAGVFLILFAVSPWYSLSVALEWLFSASQQVFSVSAQSTLHGLVPDEYRGRVMGVWGMTYSVMQPAGGLQMGGLASILSAPAAVAIGGVVVTLFAFIGAGLDGRIRNVGQELPAELHS
jgi:MFS family permease